LHYNFECLIGISIASELGSFNTASEPHFPVLEAHRTRTPTRSAHDMVSDTVIWARHDLLSGRGKDRFAMLQKGGMRTPLQSCHRLRCRKNKDSRRREDRK